MTSPVPWVTSIKLIYKRQNINSSLTRKSGVSSSVRFLLESNLTTKVTPRPAVYSTCWITVVVACASEVWPQLCEATDCKELIYDVWFASKEGRSNIEMKLRGFSKPKSVIHYRENCHYTLRTRHAWEPAQRPLGGVRPQAGTSIRYASVDQTSDCRVRTSAGEIDEPL